MRKLLAYGISTLVLFWAGNALAGFDLTRRDPGDAWPWGAELPFPWKGIQGVWKTTINKQEVYFSFRTVRSASAVKQLQITQHSVENCSWIARGAGYEEEERIVNAVMIYKNGRTFNMTVHVFRQADLKNMKNSDYVEVPGSKTITVMNLGFSGKKDWETHQLYKVHADPGAVCNSQLEVEL